MNYYGREERSQCPKSINLKCICMGSSYTGRGRVKGSAKGSGDEERAVEMRASGEGRETRMFVDLISKQGKFIFRLFSCFLLTTMNNPTLLMQILQRAQHLPRNTLHHRHG